ncbi:MAG: hypothetical protein B6245_23475 [Desulfobacteraceae bacterium 4572_88]|nr:MAG: hypothetical protein B6245_23475 [Desulfobacteraceae bacterium 4572_88]
MSDNKEVTLFIQCLVDTMYPEVGEAMVRIFQKLHIPMSCPADQTCCGQPALNSGYWEEAKAAARRFIRIFGDPAQVVVNSIYFLIFIHIRNSVALNGKIMLFL